MRLPSRLIVVRRGESDTFKMILNSPDRCLATTAVMFDRRERERRVLELQVTLERRQHQRRVEPEAMWTSSTRIESTVPKDEVRGHGAIQVREVCEDVLHSWELLRGAHEGRQVIG